DPDSPRYGESISTSAYMRRFAPNKSSVAKVKKYLKNQGLSNTHVLPRNAGVVATASSTHVAKAFKTPIRRVSRNGKKILPATSNAKVKSSIAPLVSTITGLTENEMHPLNVRQK